MPEARTTRLRGVPRGRPFAAALASVPLVAYASDFSGVMTLAFGIPALGLGCLLAAGFFIVRPSRSRKRLAVALLAPIWGAGVWLIPDALSLRRFEDEVSGPVLFFGLLALLTGLIVGLLLRRSPLPRDPYTRAHTRSNP